MDLSTIQMLKGKSNKSQIVNLAVRRYMNHEDEFLPSDISTRRLLAILHAREDIDAGLKGLILHHLHLTE
jgi:hypothetical protein